MRLTITVADDVAAEMERLRREQGLGPSEALNALARRGMARGGQRRKYVHRAHDLGLRVDISDMAAALVLLDEQEQSRCGPGSAQAPSGVAIRGGDEESGR